ncbi:MAG TPA: DUF3553 domain-containing protein [Thermohalobaculum sp.]|nr:DUF3553 domain-containing protein [Thermohalobaculum sp.]
MENPFLEVGALVRDPQAPELGLGQVQSIVGSRVTVNFEDGGKIVLHGTGGRLEIVSFDDD